MRARLYVLFLTLAAVLPAQEKGPHTYQLELPPNWKAAKALVLVLNGIDLPADRPVVLRLYAANDPSGQSFASATVPAKTPGVKGKQQVERLEMNLGEAFRRYAAKRPNRRLALTVKPYAGMVEAPEIAWHVRELRLEPR